MLKVEFLPTAEDEKLFRVSGGRWKGSEEGRMKAVEPLQVAPWSW